jgi:protein-disulfide isomerase
MEEGRKIKVKSTPTFFINGQLINGAQPLDVFTEIIEEELSR